MWTLRIYTPGYEDDSAYEQHTDMDELRAEIRELESYGKVCEIYTRDHNAEWQCRPPEEMSRSEAMVLHDCTS